MMRARILQPEEWQRIGHEGMGDLLPFIEPQNIAIVAVEDEEGKIVACVSVLRVTHFEGLWIKPEYRGNAGVFRSLVRQAYAVPISRGEHFAFGGAKDTDATMRRLCSRLGGKEMPLRFSALPLGG
jgi:hypothetical protein